MPKTYSEELYPVCERLTGTALEIISGCELTVTEHGMVDPKILSLTLLCRTIANFRAVILLIKQRMVVEARVLTRCCYENMYMVGGLHAEGLAFAERMKEDDRAGRSGRLKFAFQSDAIFESLDPEMQKELRERNETLRKAPKLDFLQPKAASHVSAFKETYVVYSQFSGDAAHPTITALARHWAPGESGKTGFFDVQPEATEDELDETLLFACIALLGIMVVVNEMVGFTEAGKTLPEINHQLQVLQDQKWGVETINEGMDILTEKPPAGQ